MQAADINTCAEAQPLVTNPASELQIFAITFPADLLSSIISTKTLDASFIASNTSFLIMEPPNTVTQL